MIISYGVSFSYTSPYAFTEHSSTTELEAVNTKIKNLLETNQNRLQASKSRGRRFNLNSERKILLADLEKVDSLLRSRIQIIAPKEPSGWSTWKKVALVGAGVILVAGAAFAAYWWYSSADSSKASTPKVQASATPSPTSQPTPPSTSQPSSPNLEPVEKVIIDPPHDPIVKALKGVAKTAKKVGKLHKKAFKGVAKTSTKIWKKLT